MKPIIGIISNPIIENRAIYKINATYIERTVEAGGIPLAIPSKINLADCERIISTIDGLIIPGGGDILPELFGEETHPKVIYALKEVDLFEMELIRLARKHNKPLLGICRGAQLINVAFGGTLYQDIPSQYKDEVCHVQSWNNIDHPMHKVYLEEDSNLYKIFGETVLDVNTLHHQSVKDLGQGLRIVGKAKDGVVEAIETEDGMIIGVQWHPENLVPNYKEYMKIFEYLIEKSKEVKDKTAKD